MRELFEPVECRRPEWPDARGRGLDAVDGTPVVDIKPVMSEFLPRGDVRQPRWSTELMRHYWRAHD
jgi:tRNA (Thr-GGU) A37 N-methylase